MKAPTWSYSSLDTFEQCPRKWYHKYILKEKEPESAAIRHGNAVHKALEDRVKGTPLPEHFMRYSPMAESIVQAWQKGMKVFTELKMGLTTSLEPCGFFGKEVWGRSAADVILKQDDVAIVFDWKTGKKREKATQLSTLALFVFKHFPGVSKITGVNLWLEPGDVGTPYIFTRAQEPELWKEQLKKIQLVEKAAAAEKFVELPGPLCAYCSVKSCQFNRS